MLGASGAFGASDASDPSNSSDAPLPERIAQLERAAIRAALVATGGNRVQAAKRLGIARATLYQKLEQYPELATAPLR